MPALIKAGGIPYTIVQSTQFFEFMGAIAQSGAVDQIVRLPSASMQPIAADDVADVMTDTALAAPLNCTIEIAGPERLHFSEFVGEFLSAARDPREVTETFTRAISALSWTINRSRLATIRASARFASMTDSADSQRS